MFELSNIYLLQLLLAGATVTLLNRLAGHYILARFEPIPYRVEAALEAVPVAVITAIVVPAAVDGGWQEWLCLTLAMLLSFKTSFNVAAFGSIGLLLVLRHLT